MRELDIIYKAFERCVEEKPEDYCGELYFDPNSYHVIDINNNSLVRVQNVYDKYDNLFDTQSRFFSYLLGFRNFKGFPKVIVDEDFDSLERISVYHGFKEFEHGASLLADFNYHYGKGWIYGTYFSDSRPEACEYAHEIKEIKSTKNSKVLEAKIFSNKGIDVNDLIVIGDYIKNENSDISKLHLNTKILNRIDELSKFIREKDASKNNIDFKRFKSFILKGAFLGVYLGFDFIDYDSGNDTYHIIVLNRESLLVPNREFKKFTKNSKSYREQTIDPEAIL